MAKLTLEEVNVIRKEAGLDPVTELPGTKKEENTPSAAELEAKKKEEEEAVKKQEEEKNQIPENNSGELDDAKVLEYLKKFNPDIKSIEDLKPKVEVDPEKEAEKREAAKVSYGLSKGVFTKKEYDNFISESKDPVNLVYDDYAQSAKKDDPNLTDEEILSEFKTQYGLDTEKGSRKYNRGQQDLALHSQKILQTKYKKILSLDSDFDQHESAAAEEKARQQKILTEAPIKKKQIEAAFEKNKKINWEADKDEVYEVEYPDEVISSVKNGMLDPKFVERAIEEEWDEEKIQDIVDTMLRKAGLAHILKGASAQYMNKHAKGSHGIPPDGGKEATRVPIEPKLSKNQKVMYDEYVASQAN